MATPTTELKYKQTTFEYFNRMLLGPHYELQTDRIQVHLFLNSNIILKKINSNFISRKFISNFAKVFEHHFLQDMVNMDVREEVLDFFNIPPEHQSYSHEIVAMSVPHYLEFARGIAGAEFRLISQAVNDGTVTITNRQFVLMLRTKLEAILLKRIQDMKPVDHVMGIDESWMEGMRERYKTHETVIHTNKPGTMPPCMQVMVDKAHTSHHLSHIERVTLGIYLKSRGYDGEYILDIFRGLSDWDEKVTRYQLGRLDRYQCYGCDKMETEGLCRKQEDKLNICSHIRNPYLYG